MKLNEFLTESQQRELATLQEGPLGSLAKAAARGVGNVIGGAAKAVGAAKGAVKGAVDRVKKDFKSGEKGAYAALAGKPDPNTGSAGGTTSTPKLTTSAGGAGSPTPTGGTTSTPKPTTSAGGAGSPTPTGGTTAQGGGDQPKKGILGKVGQFVKDFKTGYQGDDDAEIAAQPKGGTTATPKPTAQGGNTGGTTATPEPTAQGGNTGGTTATPEPTAQGGDKQQQPKTTSVNFDQLTKQVSSMDAKDRDAIVALLQNDPDVKVAQKQTTQPDTSNDSNQSTGNLSPGAFGKMATDLAGGAQKAADAKPQQTNQPLPAGGKGQRGNFDAQTGEPLTQYGQQQKSQADLKAKLKAGQGLAKTSGDGYKQGIRKGNMRLGAGRGGVTMSHVPQGNIVKENFSIYRKQTISEQGALKQIGSITKDVGSVAGMIKKDFSQAKQSGYEKVKSFGMSGTQQRFDYKLPLEKSINGQQLTSNEANSLRDLLDKLSSGEIKTSLGKNAANQINLILKGRPADKEMLSTIKKEI